MHNVFGEYGRYYDVLYDKKDYEGEIDFVLRLSRIFGARRPSSILDMGCGTGGHILPLARKKIQINGFDRSETMVEIATAKIKRSRLQSLAKASIGDVLNYRDGKQYDLVISMFAVMGYLTETHQFSAALQTAAIHLKEEGVFVFDVWFGPAVLRDLPQTRIQEFSLGGKRMIKLVRPELDHLRNFVKVNYTLLKFLPGGKVEEIRERHEMRYFFAPEVKHLAGEAGLEIVGLFPFKDESRTPSLNDWNVTFVAKRKS